MKMIAGAILILAAVVALGFAFTGDQVVDRQLLALFGLVFWWLAWLIFLPGHPAGGRRSSSGSVLWASLAGRRS
jgi:hypothetical protein